jgi:hypothetical protein
LVFHIERGNRLKVVENRVLRKILGPKRNEVTKQWRRLHKKELYVFAPHAILSPDRFKMNEMGRACSTCWGEEMCLQSFDGKT